MKGVFITFEGVEGAGKTTRSRALCKALSAAGYEVRSTREPGGTPVSERIREVLLDKGLHNPPACELMLFLAARAANVDMVVSPWLARGGVVVGDRFTDATLAYQAFGRGLPRPQVEAACRFAAGGLVPDLTVLLDLDPEEGLRRHAGDGRPRDRMEEAGMDFHRRVRDGYLALAGEASDRYLVLPGHHCPEALDERILGRAMEVLRQKSEEREP
jgi:dTMP kinase